ncbi:MAG: diaminopimelate epimerase [Firmicutes bacterium]|nr:diaminopimelate epimerase [Bacillota bacterium]
MQFAKMEGLGNDFILVDGKLLEGKNLPEISRVLCDRHFGIGADGLILVLPSKSAETRMRVFNADGSEAEMCGNGIRCFAKYVYEKKIIHKDEFTVETLAGILKPKLFKKNGKIMEVEVDMGEPNFLCKYIPVHGHPSSKLINEEVKIGRESFKLTCLSMGNPHCVVFVDYLSDVPANVFGPLIEKHHLFPNKTNVEFVQVVSRNRLEMRVWERGVGETLACGTGACAAVAAGVETGRCDRNVQVDLPGGVLKIRWEDDKQIYMRGSCREVFTGEYLDL